MEFKVIDVSQWSRKEYFEHYLNQVNCTYSMTLNLDLTLLLQEIKRLEIKLYPTMIYLISKIVNRHEEFRTSIDPDGNVGVFDLLHPSYTVLQKDREAFTSLWTEYAPTLAEFHKKYMSDIQNYGEVPGIIAKPDIPVNIFNISSIPWVSFTGFNLNLPKVTHYLLPIFTTGKYFEENGKIKLPMAIQVHHAVCDGFHVARFVNELQEAMDNLRQLQE